VLIRLAPVSPPFKAVIPGLKVVVIEGATHFGARQTPAQPEFMAAVHDFIVTHHGPQSPKL
jgi:hypothetical protein